MNAALKKVFFYFIGLLIIFCAIEVFLRFYIRKIESIDYEAYSSMKQNEPRYIAEPYLNYINNSRFVNEKGERQINSLGIKDTAEITVQKQAGVYRILFLGGSTTYGLVDETRNTFPALIERSLNLKKDSLLPGYTKVECINGGLCGGTSAEILTHYLMKLNYLQPDLVVVHTGFNDAITYLALCNSQYQPDYHNSRNLFPVIEPLGPVWKFLLKSETISVLVYYFKYYKYVKSSLESNIFFRFNNQNEWLPFGNDSIYNIHYNAFYNNIKNVITIAKSNNQKVLLVTEIVDSAQLRKACKGLGDTIMSTVATGYFKNKEMLQRLSAECGVPVCILREQDFPADFFQNDGLHVNEKGELEKASNIETSIIENQLLKK